MPEMRKLSISPVEVPKKMKVETCKRVDHFGRLVVDRKMLNSSLVNTFIPDYLVLGVPLSKLSKEGAMLAKNFIQGNVDLEYNRRELTRISIKINTRTNL